MNKSIAQTPITTDNLYRYLQNHGNQSGMWSYQDPRDGKWYQLLMVYGADKRAKLLRREYPHCAFDKLVDVHDELGGDELEPDSHNWPAVAVSRDGYIHITSNHHVDPFNFAISDQPWDCSSFTNESPVVSSSDENRVTYPAFVQVPGGDLLMFFREQEVSPSRFRYLVYAWNETTQQWEKRGQDLNTGTELRLYISTVSVDPSTGRIHLFAMWRDDAGPGTGAGNSEDYWHMYSDDQGQTWRQLESPGSTVSLPLNIGTVPNLIRNTQPHPNDLNLVNLFSSAVDANGDPHGLVPHAQSAGGGSRQWHHYWWNGSGWSSRVISSFSYDGNGVHLVRGQGLEMWAVYLDSSGDNSCVRAVNLTPTSPQYDDEEIELTCQLSHNSSSPILDFSAFNRGEDILSLFTVRATASPPRQADEDDRPLWRQDGQVITYEGMNSIRQYGAPYQLQEISRANNLSGSGPWSVSLPSLGDQSCPVSYYAKMTARGSGGSVWLDIGNGDRIGEVEMGGVATKTTPIMPLLGFSGGSLSVNATNGFNAQDVDVIFYRLNGCQAVERQFKEDADGVSCLQSNWT
ncbi:hypothetical protein AB833_19440 [Chromatiales bacterium (ex Bugula neritina AB1)]|nr:hypothetical protein AB833_19440 [Chromatiales bacterium (ex Bugula neritina AB1)]